MSRNRKSFSPDVLAALRAMPVIEVLDLMGLYWKRDADFVPIKDKSTLRLYVSIDGGVVELLATGLRWYDSRVEKGGGGAIDLVMHLYRLDFVSAVKLLMGASSQAMPTTHNMARSTALIRSLSN